MCIERDFGKLDLNMDGKNIGTGIESKIERTLQAWCNSEGLDVPIACLSPFLSQ